MFNKTNKKYIVIITVTLLLISGLFIYFYINRDQSAIKVCESSIDYNKGIGLTFYVGKDGKTIDKIEKNDTVSIDFIKNNLTDDEKNSEKILEEYKKKAEELFDLTVEKYQNIPWFAAEIEQDESYIHIKYSFNISHESFNYEEHEDLIKEFALQYYYNTDESKFIFDEAVYLSENTPLGNIDKITCSTLPRAEIEYESTNEREAN